MKKTLLIVGCVVLGVCVYNKLKNKEDIVINPNEQEVINDENIEETQI